MGLLNTVINYMVRSLFGLVFYHFAIYYIVLIVANIKLVKIETSPYQAFKRLATFV